MGGENEKMGDKVPLGEERSFEEERHWKQGAMEGGESLRGGVN